MYFPNDSILPENQVSLTTNATTSSPAWMPEDFTSEQKEFNVSTGGFAGEFEIARY